MALSTEQKLSRKIQHLLAGDAELRQKADQFLRGSAANLRETLREGSSPNAPDQLILESIILRTARPVVTIHNNQLDLQLNDVDSQEWKTVLTNAAQVINSAIVAVGRIELQHHSTYSWVGTGWLVTDDIIVTNRHVADVFAAGNGNRFVFRKGLNGMTLESAIDFLEEAGRTDELSFRITGILHIEKEGGPDIALLQVETQATIAAPIDLSPIGVLPGNRIAVIGYPARDSRIPEEELMLQIYGDLFDKKRLAPGKVMNSSANLFTHDCTTLGGNSGSVIIDLTTGKAVGLHFGGNFLEANYAVPAQLIHERVKAIQRGRNIDHILPVQQDDQPANKVNAQAITPLTIPITLSISVQASIDPAAMQHPVINKVDFAVDPGPARKQEEFIAYEKIQRDYSDRQGYDAKFLGKDCITPLPEIAKKHKEDILHFTSGKRKEWELRYMHFSVVMRKSRRMCFYSAVNINGKQSLSMKRGPWLYDTRIPKEYQIMEECYGNAPLFSRGHMTRREDPIWGEEVEANIGNKDSMHVTNTVPQMQTMNAGIWLKLENYALQNARKDDMKISVFTGPVMSDDDEPAESYISEAEGQVLVPKSFWKIIVFLHDKTDQLCATGYKISQEPFVNRQEYIFGEHGTSQVTIKSIERETGLSFGRLSSLDPLANELPFTAPAVIRQLEQIRFI